MGLGRSIRVSGGGGGGSISSSPTSSNGSGATVIQLSGCLAIELYRTTPAISLPEAIRTARESRGMRQKDLAALIGVHPKTVAAWDHGRKIPHARHRQELVRILQLPVLPNEQLPEFGIRDAARRKYGISFW